MEQLSIDDCTECAYDFCETDSCKGPEDLPDALIRNFDSIESVMPKAPERYTNCITGCSIEQKAYYCCHKNQVNGESVIKIFPDNELVIKALRVCPSLGVDGLCIDYDEKPSICEKFRC